MTINRLDEESGFGITDIIEFARRNAAVLAATTLTGGILSVGIAMTIPKEWSATVVLQVGQIYSGPTGQNGVTYIEPPPRALERVKLGSFENAVLTQLGLPLATDVNKETDIIRGSARAMLIRNADLISITVRGFSDARAKQYAEAYERELINEHALLAKASIGRLASDLQEVSTALNTELARRAELDKIAKSSLAQAGAGRFSESVLLSELISRNDAEIRTLRLRKSALQEQLNPELTFNTRALGDVDVSRKPIYPQKSVFGLLGVMAGLIVGVLLGAWREKKHLA
ncbi:chain-length determining protein [Ralstonia mannitolilytica]|uniref:chain-length determining protein n=1 Tax=Ralstonia mannitolilytica TaxID=105219 RepID=UPI0011AEE1DE|nr:chain-length determining protein [Ralstonia mannitolilytica]MBU9578530.1 chain-length determining protein [Ralstonia mannitolilytica]